MYLQGEKSGDKYWMCLVLGKNQQAHSSASLLTYYLQVMTKGKKRNRKILLAIPYYFQRRNQEEKPARISTR